MCTYSPFVSIEYVNIHAYNNNQAIILLRVITDLFLWIKYCNGYLFIQSKLRLHNFLFILHILPFFATILMGLHSLIVFVCLIVGRP